MDIKLVFLLILGISVSVWAYPETECGSGPHHNFIFGPRNLKDRLLYTTRVTIPKVSSKVQTYDFKWPNIDWPVYRIIRFEVLDQLPDGSGGCAFLTGGSPVTEGLTFHLKTQRGGALDFDITIYGHYVS